jgi:hypothetical protein
MSGGRMPGKRPTWTMGPHSVVATLGPWSVHEAFPGTKYPWAVHYKGVLLQRPHGNYTGYQRFMTEDNARRWVEKQQARK